MYRLNKLSEYAGVGSFGGGLVGLVTQSEFVVWTSGVTMLGGAVLILVARLRRDNVAISELERDSILRDPRAEIRDLRKELHDLRAELFTAQTRLAINEAVAARLALLPTPSEPPK